MREQDFNEQDMELDPENIVELVDDEGNEVRYQDERLTTRLATGVLLEADVRRSRRKDVVDKLAANYILQSFLDAGGWK